MAGGTLTAPEGVLVVTPTGSNNKSRAYRRSNSSSSQQPTTTPTTNKPSPPPQQQQQQQQSRGEEPTGRRYHTTKRVAPVVVTTDRTMAARDKIQPAETAPHSRRSQRKAGLRIEQPSKPTSTLSSSSTNRSNRGRNRSPGKVRPSKTTTPDFITQTDRYGNASTPRSSDAIRTARIGHPSGLKPHLHVTKTGALVENPDEQSPLEACTETLLDSLRIMCCCLNSSSEDKTDKNKQQKQQLVPKQAKQQAPEDDHTTSTTEDIPKILPSIHPNDVGKKCLVLDLDETLVHSSFRAVPGADFVIPVQIEDVVHFVYVAKRPGVDDFLVEMAKHYEIVIYTASLNKYADPLLDLLDPHKTIRSRLFRESCVYYEGNYVKDLSLLDRDLSQTIIVDNSPSSYIFHPENAIDCTSFIDDQNDRELDQIGAFLADVRNVADVRSVCHQWKEWPVPPPKPSPPAAGQKQQQQQQQQQQQRQPPAQAQEQRRS
ncbi:hypothetical protein ACA910_019693 [Epithemia clementina (nom. ined.)]